MKTRAERMREAISEMGGRTTSQGNPKRIGFTMPSGTTLDDITDSIAEVPGFVIRKDGIHFAAVDLRK